MAIDTRNKKGQAHTMYPGGASQSVEQRSSDDDALRAFQTALGRAEKPHTVRCSKFRERHDAYKGILSTVQTERIPILRPRGIVLPRYAYQAAEVLVSNLSDEHPKGTVSPMAPDDIVSAKAMQQVQNYYRRQDEQEQKMSRFARQTVVMGMSPGKVFWKNSERTRPRRTWRMGIDGSMQESVEDYTHVTDRPSFEPIDVYDFMYDPSASRTDQLGYVLIRYWVTVKSLEASGNYRNLDKLQDTKTDISAESRMTGRDHSGTIEVIEFWSAERLITVANRVTVIQDEPNPYHHCQIPIILTNTTPDLYTCDGVSVMDLLIPLQAAAWDVLNQLLRNADLANLLMVKVARTARFDKKQLTNADVGAVFDVDNENDVTFFNAGGNILEPGMTVLQMLKTTMQETTGTGVYLAGGASETIDQKTATGINVLSSMAQKLVLAMRSVMWAEYRRKGLQEIELIQQLCPRPLVYRITGMQGPEAWKTVMPWELAGNYDFDVGDQAESLNKQTARAEAQQLFSTFAQGAAAMQQAGVKPNWPLLGSGVAEAFDKVDPDSYVEAVPPPPLQLPPGVPQPGVNGAGALPGPANAGALG